LRASFGADPKGVFHLSIFNDPLNGRASQVKRESYPCLAVRLK